MQQAEFIGAKVQRMTVPPCLQRGEIDQQRSEFETFGHARPCATGLQGHHAVENGGAVDRPDQIIVGPGAQGPALVVGIVLFEQDGDMRIFHPRVRAQAPAHLQSRKIVHHPVDKDADRPFDKAPWPVGIETPESIADIAVLEIGPFANNRIGQEDIDRSHVVSPHPVPRSDGAAM